MRCLSCNCELTDEESVKKGINTGEYLDMCYACLSTIPEVELVDSDGIEVVDEVEDNED